MNELAKWSVTCALALALSLPVLGDAASSEALIHPRAIAHATPVGSAESVCERKKQIALWVMQAKQKGITKDEWLEEHPVTDEYEPPVKAWATWLVEEAFSWSGGAADFGDHVKSECVEGRH